jgi:tetratricopeptide (TPR) repeat protein
VRTFDAFPQEWADTQNNLAAAYSNRIRREKADNLEKAITAYQEALKVRTFDAFPEDWAMTQRNLGEAYRNRIRGDKACNLERAIAYCQEALKVYTFDAFRQDWAMTQNNLAVAYRDRIRGDKACNLERAIAYCQEALKVYTFDAFPQQWAATQNNLAIAYRYRIRGDKADNLERAITAYQEALKVYTFDAFPQQWARIQNNLAIAYSNRIRGEKAENIKQAVMCYQNALQGYETAGDFLNAAEMGLTLGKIKVDRGEWYQGLAYLEKSLKIYRQFDDLKSRADTIYQIAHTHHLIGNHEKASIYYRDALRFYEYLKHDRGVAFCQASLGRLMLQIGFVEKAEELLKKATFIFKELNNEQEIAKIAEVLNCLAKIKEKQAV